MKIAIISSGFLPVIDGVTVTLLARLPYLSQQQHEVLLFCPDYSSLSSIYPNWQSFTGNILPRVRVVNLPSTSFMDLEFERNVQPSGYAILLAELAKFKPDIIHVDEPERLWLGFLRRAGRDYAKKVGIPCVCFFHTNFIEYLEDYLLIPAWLLKILQLAMVYHRNWIYNGYDLTLASSPTTAKRLTNLGIKNIKNAQLLGIDLARYQNLKKEQDFWETAYSLRGIDKKIKVLFLGRLTPDKGWNFTLDSFQEFKNIIAWEKLAFIIAGAGEMGQEIKEKLRHLTPFVYLVGRINPEQVPAFLSHGDIYVTTSHKETRGLTVLEALAAGISVLAPRAGGIVDSIKSGENGWLFTPQDREDFVTKLQLLSSDGILRAEMGAKARLTMQSYQLETTLANLTQIWREQIEAKMNLPGGE